MIEINDLQLDEQLDRDAMGRLVGGGRLYGIVGHSAISDDLAAKMQNSLQRESNMAALLQHYSSMQEAIYGRITGTAKG